jgi:hypothetical protein
MKEAEAFAWNDSALIRLESDVLESGVENIYLLQDGTTRLLIFGMKGCIKQRRICTIDECFLLLRGQWILIPPRTVRSSIVLCALIQCPTDFVVEEFWEVLLGWGDTMREGDIISGERSQSSRLNRRQSRSCQVTASILLTPILFTFQFRYILPKYIPMHLPSRFFSPPL